MLTRRTFLLRSAAFSLAASLFLSPLAVGQVQEKSTAPEFVPGSWTMVLLPDTQVYSLDYPGLFTMQTRWIAENKDKLNIRYVLHLGDITDGSRPFEWERAREAMNELDGHVPYALVPGNHDYHALADRRTRLNEYFPVAKFKKWPTFGGAMNDDMCNSYHLFSAGGVDWIVLALEWAPRDEAVAWANDILAKYPDRKAILLTHAYLYSDGTRYNFAAKPKEQEASPHGYPCNTSANDGEELWNKLVRKNNVPLVVCGHIGNGRGFLTSGNDRGKMTQQMLVDYQSWDVGGGGFLRILEFQPDGKTVQAKSYSPLYDKYLPDPGSCFKFELD